MTALFELYRPRSLDAVVGQEAAVRQVGAILARSGAGGRAFWITGPSGTGKSSLAKIIAESLAAALCTEEVDAGSLTPAKVRELERYYAIRPLPIGGKSGWAILVNECHGLRKDTVRLLLDALERLPQHVVWVFTTTSQGQASFFDDDTTGDAAPLVSRCVEVQLRRADEAFAARAREIAVAEGIDGYDPTVYQKAATACGGNFRRLLQRIEAGQLADTAEGAMPVAVVAAKPKKLAALPNEKTLKALPLPQLRAMCLERGLPAGWVEKCSVSTAVQRLVKWGAA